MAAATSSSEAPLHESTTDSFRALNSFSHASDVRGGDRDEADTCRICRGEGTEQEPLFYPCKCSGSIKYVHQDCLMEWLSHTQKKHCELCKTSFRFTKLYHPGMPNRIPTTVFLRRAALHVLNVFVAWCRGVLVAAVWLLLLPLCMRVVWRTLFWVGDGGWSPDNFPAVEEATEATETSRFTSQGMDQISSALEAAKTSNTAQNLTVSNLFMSISYSQPNATISRSIFWNFAKRLILSVPYPFAQIAQITYLTPFSVNSTNPNSASKVLGARNPSLLSDISFFHWFQSPTTNRFIIDVLEGQIITLFVVVALILIFLIREWVVQQQPVINMVAFGDDAAAHPPANAEIDEPVDMPDEDAEVVVEADNARTDGRPRAAADADHNLLTRAASFPVQNAIFDNNSQGVRSSHARSNSDRDGTRMVQESGSSAVSISPAIPDQTGTLHDASPAEFYEQPVEYIDFTRDDQYAQLPSSIQPALPNAARTIDQDIRDTASNLAPGSAHAEISSSVQRPEMPVRSRSSIANEIRREIQEQKSWSLDSEGGEPMPLEKEEGSAPSQQIGQLSQAEHQYEEQVEQAQESEHSSESWQQVSDVIADDNSNQVLEGARWQDKGKSRAANDESRPEDGFESNIPNSSSELETTPADKSQPEASRSSASHPFAFQEESSVLEHDEASTEEQTLQVDHGPVADPGQAQQDPFNLFLDWMYQDIAPAAPAADDIANDERIVRIARNIINEAPFVPVNENAQRMEPEVLLRDPQVAAAIAQAGIDNNDDENDQEAIDDAEDLEGILELIGMQGPIVGLFQNALFSVVLISAALACAVWIPYLWGKVVILFMGSPVSLFIKLPVQFIATMTDLTVDFTLFSVAWFTYLGTYFISTLIRFCTWDKWAQTVENSLRSISVPAQSLADSALDRITKVLMESPLSPRPDYFRLSVNSHIALRSLQNTTSFAMNETCNFATSVIERASMHSPPKLLFRILTHVPRAVQESLNLVHQQSSTIINWLWASRSYKITINFDLGQNTPATYIAMERWTATDRLIAIFAGYAFFGVAGALYLKRTTPFSTSQQGQKIERIVSDILQQAGGVLKVILIISIEMLAFPLYCGILLDLAMLPLFKNATLLTRWQYARDSPWTSGFVHWFIGTCYMFHFALFVSMCRKIMRKGVLYFIRDPDDPTFHPVRDVLERNVTTQLRKIAFSALVYGALVIVCLGGVIWSLSRITSDVLPIHWTTEASSLEFPLDLLFYNFLTPIIIRFYKPSETLHSLYRWWFKKCASFLRLSNFLFGDKVKEQEASDGKYVRAPASDLARIPKGTPVFVEVDENDVRKDGDTTDGVHNSDLVTVVYIPSWFRVRIFTFVVIIWVFMGLSSVSVTILPLLLGRYLFSLVLPASVAMNDIHAFSLGIYTFGSLAYTSYYAYKLLSSLQGPASNSSSAFHTIASTTSRLGFQLLRFIYVWTSLILAIPFLFAVLIELYFLMPLHAYLSPSEPHVIHFIQDWTLGFLYARLAARILVSNRFSRPSRAFNAVMRNGWLHPNAAVATRCFIAPVFALFAISLAIPASLAVVASKMLYWVANDEKMQSLIWRYSFPAVGVTLFVMWGGKEVLRLLLRWRMVVRDEVYLVGEKLHNFGEKKAPTPIEPRRERSGQAGDGGGDDALDDRGSDHVEDAVVMTGPSTTEPHTVQA